MQAHWLELYRHLPAGMSDRNDNNGIERHNPRFLTILSLCFEVSPTCMFMCNTSGAYQVQHVMCHMVRREFVCY